ncbi:MAG TPA: rhomboid family intramembrane serine protease [Nitrospirota bacterium]|jgi:membrane associated rhomboid family serine protease
MIPFKDDNPAKTVPYVTVGLIATNLFVFSYMLMLGDRGSDAFVMEYSVVPARLFPDISGMNLAGLVTPFSSMFMHGGFLHIAGNMLYLWIFGDNIEDALGHFGYLVFYLGCGVAAVMLHSLMNPGSTLPMLGASGAVAGVLGAYMVLYPKARVWTVLFFVFFWQVVKLPAVLVIGLWILLQVLSGVGTLGSETGGGVAWFAHIGGFIAGLVLLAVMGGRKKRARR